MLKQRVGAALVFAPALLGLVWWGGVALEVTCACLSLLMLWEFLRLTVGPGKTILKLLAYALTVVVVGTVLGRLPPSATDGLAPTITLALLIATLARPVPFESSFRNAALVALGVGYCGVLIPYLSRLRSLDEGLGLALAALFCTWGADTGAYFAGRYFGTRKLAPQISPAKTVEGAVGGLVAAIAIAFLIRALFGLSFNPFNTVMLGVIAGVLGVAGDLWESLLKRSAGAKDSSSLIPGHGGVLDRFDAVMFVAPSMFIYARWVGAT